MNPPRSKWPSLGFLAVCVTYGLVALFFMWGFSTPSLDRIWTIRHELKIGEMKRLKKADRQLLISTLERDDWVASEFLGGQGIGLISEASDGWIATPTATILRTNKALAIGALVFDVQTPSDLMPYRLEIRGANWQEELQVEKPGVMKLDLPDPPLTAEIIEVRLRGQDFVADPSVLGLRVTFAESK